MYGFSDTIYVDDNQLMFFDIENILSLKSCFKRNEYFIPKKTVKKSPI